MLALLVTDLPNGDPPAPEATDVVVKLAKDPAEFGQEDLGEKYL